MASFGQGQVPSTMVLNSLGVTFIGIYIVSYLIPQPRIFVVAVLTICCDLIARLLAVLNDIDLTELTLDIGEFSEIMVYYVFLLYLWQLIFHKQWQTPTRPIFSGEFQAKGRD